MKTARYEAGFSLVEITLAVGIAAFCLIAVYGLLPTGMATHRAAISQTTGAQILSAVYADLQNAPAAGPSTLFGVSDGTPATLYFDAAGVPATAAVDRIYRLTINFPGYSASSRAATQTHLLLTWPGSADPAEAAGSYQILAAFDRNR